MPAIDAAFPGVVKDGAVDRDEPEPRALHDHVAVDRGCRQHFGVSELLVSQGRAHLRGEVGDVGGVEARNNFV